MEKLKLKKSLLLAVLSIVFVLPCVSRASDETLTITTYYPSPYGVYNEFTTYSNTNLAISGGRVGIGTSRPMAGLHVESGSGTIVLHDPLVTDFMWKFDQYKTAGPDSGRLAIHTADLAGNYLVECLSLASNGDVGIGTVDPQTKLHIQGNGGTVQLQPDTVTAQNYLQVQNLSGVCAIGVEGSVGETAFAKSLPYAAFLLSGSSGADLQLGTNGSADVTIKKGGNIGIGTTAPTGKLHVSGTGAGAGACFERSNKGLYLDPNHGDQNNYAQILSDQGMGMGFYTNSTDGNGGTLSLYLNANGNVGMGTISPTHLIHLSGGAFCNGTGDWIAGSDRAYKRDIDYDFQYGLKEVEQLKPVYYVHKEDKDNRKQVGFIAQDVLKVIPELVSGDEGALGLSYGQLTAVLVKAAQEQQDIISAQQDEIVKLKARLDKLEVGIK